MLLTSVWTNLGSPRVEYLKFLWTWDVLDCVLNHIYMKQNCNHSRLLLFAFRILKIIKKIQQAIKWAHLSQCSLTLHPSLAINFYVENYNSFSVYQTMDSAFRAFESDWLLRLGIVNNYSPKWRWMAVDIYQAAQRRGKYPPLSPTLR